MSTKSLTVRQAEILAFIVTHIKETGFPPTRVNIANELGFKSPNAAEEHLRALARKGAIEIMAGTSRGIRVMPPYIGTPIIGCVAAGNPILAQEHIDDYCDIAGSCFHPHADYFLKVHGNSMVGAGILDGDLLAVHQTHCVESGDIVVARVDDEVTVKRFKKTETPSCVLLLPENSEYQPMKINLHQQTLTIEGRSVGVIRR